MGFYVRMYEITEKMERIEEEKLIGEKKLMVPNGKDFHWGTKRYPLSNE